MHIISTNIGQARTMEWNGKEIRTGIFKYPVDEPIVLGNEDVEQDDVIDRKYHGGIDKACYLYSADHYDYWRKEYPELEMPWGVFGENLTVKGLNEAEVNIGNIYSIGTAVVQTTQPRQPCFKLEFRFQDKQIVRKFVDSGFPGIYVRVLQEGSIKKGDEMLLLEKKDTLPIKKIFELLYASEFDPLVEKAVNDPFIADSCKKDLLKRWGAEL